MTQITPKPTPEEIVRRRILARNDTEVLLTREGFEEFIREYRKAGEALLDMSQQINELIEVYKKTLTLMQVEKMIYQAKRKEVNLN